MACHSPGTESDLLEHLLCAGSELGAGEMRQPELPPLSELGRGLGVKEIVARTLRALELAQLLCPGKQVSSRRPPLTLLPVPSQVARCQPGAGGGTGWCCRRHVRGAEQGPPQSTASWASLSLPPSRYSRAPNLGSGLWAEWTQTLPGGPSRTRVQPTSH